MKKAEHDKRYASGRQAAAFDKQRNPPAAAGSGLYRSELLRQKFNAAGGDYRNTAALIGIAVNTLRDAIDGNASKIQVLFQIANHWNIPWKSLFEVKPPAGPSKIYK